MESKGAGEQKPNWWQRLPTWAKWTIGVVGAFVILVIGAAIGQSGSKEGQLTDEVASLEKEVETAKNEAEKAEAAEGEAIKAGEEKAAQIVEGGEAKAKKIVGTAGTDSEHLGEKINEQKNELDSLEGKVSSTESKLASLRGEEGEAEEIAAKSTIPGSGIFQAEVDYIPGTYKSNGGNLCYWATLNSANTNDIADNENAEGPQIVEITTPYFQTSGCSKWTRVSE